MSASSSPRQQASSEQRAMALMREKEMLEGQLATLLAMQEGTGDNQQAAFQSSDEGEDLVGESGGDVDLARLTAIRNVIDELQQSYDRGEKGPEELAQDLERIMSLGNELDALNSAVNSARLLESHAANGTGPTRNSTENKAQDDFDYNEESSVCSQEDVDFIEERSDSGGEGHGAEEQHSVSTAQLADMLEAIQLQRGRDDSSNGTAIDAESVLALLARAMGQQELQEGSAEESPRIVELPDEYDENDESPDFEKQAQAAHAMLEEVQQLKKEISELSNLNTDDPRVREAQSLKYGILIAKMEELEARRGQFAAMLSSERDLLEQASAQAAAKPSPTSESAQRKPLIPDVVTQQPRRQEQQRQQQQKTPKQQLQNQSHQGGSPQPVESSENTEEEPVSQDEIRKVMTALEQARQLGRAKSLQLKRQEQEVATLQRNIEGLEKRLGTLQPASEENAPDRAEGASSVLVEPARSTRLVRSPGSAGSALYEENENDENDGDRLTNTSCSDDEGASDNEEDCDGDKETQDDIDVADTASLLQKQLQANKLFGTIRGVTKRPTNTENASVTARVGSAVGDSTYQDSISSASLWRNAGSQLGAHAKDDASVSMSTAEGYRSSGLRLPSNKYLSLSDWSLLLSNVHDLIDDCRSRSEEGEVDDREFGREILNLLTKILSELGHIDLSNEEVQRQVVRSLRQLSLRR
mmetsp:Transcript_18810/g.34854  ORF Transcript_18810/g.34854 Transcript_18810/m.34854 type:complete len:700 (+) Transcript_18810:44-2143(+)